MYLKKLGYVYLLSQIILEEPLGEKKSVELKLGIELPSELPVGLGLIDD
jgi:hypothetical protein